jgi:hypothetical protein
MHSRSSAIDRARAKYKEINWLIAKYPDFQVDELEKSRRFFDLSKPELPTRAFDVVACVVGLPVPASLQRALARKGGPEVITPRSTGISSGGRATSLGGAPDKRTG